MALSVYPQKYLDTNTQQTKTPAVVVQIEGIDFLSNTPLYTRIRYGDPNIIYGQPGLVYGGLIRRPGVRDYLSIDQSSLVIQQKVEPESGRGNVSIMTLGFIDKDGYMSQVISPGIIVPEILGRRVRIYLGFSNTSFPEDYFTVFRGYITGTTSGSGYVTLQLSDASLKRRQVLFSEYRTSLTAPIDNVTLSVPVTSTEGAFDQVLGPSGAYDSGVKTYLKVADEFMQYGPGALGPTSFTVLSRGSRGTTAVAHTTDDEVAHAIELTGNAYDLLLKLMLSGWNGPCIENISILSFVQTSPTIGAMVNAITLPLGVNAVDDYGIAVGDYLTVTGSAGNNGTYKVTGFLDYDELVNNIVLTDGTFVFEYPTTAVMDLRSQYDTFPIEAGLKLDPVDVDVASHVQIKNNFLSQDQLQFFIKDPESSGKTFLESQIHLPMSTYPVTRYGKISAAINKPPIAAQKLPVLDKDTILNPDKIVVTRATNNRRLFNEIKYTYDKDDAGNYLSTSYYIDSESLTNIGIASQLPIISDGLRSTLNGTSIANRHANFLLSRYKSGAYEISVETNWQVGGIIETGDSVLVKDNGGLKITNFNTGERDLGTQLFEVIDRKLDIKSGRSTLQLLSSPGYSVSNRYATISPSSKISSATTSYVIIKESYGGVYPGREFLKWSDFVGQRVLIHSYDWVTSEETTFTGFDPTNNFKMMLDPPLSFIPSVDDIVDIPFYPTNTDIHDQEIYKLLYIHIDPTLTIVSGTSGTVFDLSAPDAARTQVGLPILIHNADYSILSPESIVLSVVGTTVTVKTDLGFTPAAGQKVELVGFQDGGGAYRIL